MAVAIKWNPSNASNFIKDYVGNGDVPLTLEASQGSFFRNYITGTQWRQASAVVTTPNWQIWEPVTGGGGGDMFKSVYDTNNDGVVDNSEKLAGFGYTTVRSAWNHLVDPQPLIGLTSTDVQAALEELQVQINGVSLTHWSEDVNGNLIPDSTAHLHSLGNATNRIDTIYLASNLDVGPGGISTKNTSTPGNGVYTCTPGQNLLGANVEKKSHDESGTPVNDINIASVFSYRNPNISGSVGMEFTPGISSFTSTFIDLDSSNIFSAAIDPDAGQTTFTSSIASPGTDLRINSQITPLDGSGAVWGFAASDPDGGISTGYQVKASRLGVFQAFAPGTGDQSYHELLWTPGDNKFTSSVTNDVTGSSISTAFSLLATTPTTTQSFIPSLAATPAETGVITNIWSPGDTEFTYRFGDLDLDLVAASLEASSFTFGNGVTNTLVLSPNDDARFGGGIILGATDQVATPGDGTIQYSGTFQFTEGGVTQTFSQLVNSAVDADTIGYNNIASGLAATSIQSAIDEVVTSISTNASADVSGPGSVINNAFAAFDGVTGKVIKAYIFPGDTDKFLAGDGTYKTVVSGVIPTDEAFTYSSGRIASAVVNTAIESITSSYAYKADGRLDYYTVAKISGTKKYTPAYNGVVASQIDSILVENI